MGKIPMLAAFAVAMLLASAVPFALPQKPGYSVEEADGWRIIKTDVITIAVPSNKTIPLYVWWYNEENDTVYVARYAGVAEAWLFGPARFRHHELFDEGEALEHALARKGCRWIAASTDEFGEALRALLDAADSLMRLGPRAGMAEVEDMIEELNDLKKELEGVKEKLGTVLPEEALEVLNAIDEAMAAIDEATGKLEEFATAPEQTRMGMLNMIATIGRTLSEVHRTLDVAMRSMFKTVVEVRRRLAEARKEMHPFFFPFPQGTWELTDIEEIKAEDGTVIGIAFAFKLVDVINPKFEFLEGNVMIRNRLYFVPVEEVVGNETVTLTRAELKSDIIISNWKWNVDAFKEKLGNYSTLFPTLDAKLVLIAKFTVRPAEGGFMGAAEEDLEAELAGEERGVPPYMSVEVRVGPKRVMVGQEYEDDIVPVGKLPKVVIATNETTVAGFFRFVPTALVIGPDGNVTVPVKGVFFTRNRLLRVFLVYPYFGDLTLEHDPSIGVEVPAAEEEPVYTITPPSGTEVVPEVVTPVEEITTTPSPDLTLLVPIAVAAVAAVAVAAIALRKRARPTPV